MLYKVYNNYIYGPTVCKVQTLFPRQQFLPIRKQAGENINRPAGESVNVFVNQLRS
jgi:hypothetical protein